MTALTTGGRPSNARYMDNDPAKAAVCAANNADLYEAVFHAHGIGNQRNTAMWWSEETAPPYYSNVTTLDPEAHTAQSDTVERLKSALDRPFSVKDAFCRLNLASQGFRTLFNATWIWAEPERIGRSPRDPTPTNWRRIDDPAALKSWERAWAAGGSPADMRVFPEAILDHPDIMVLGRTAAEGFDAGCIVNLSQDAAGLSNVFSTAEPETAIFEEAALAAAAVACGRPLVGYERGDMLGAAVAAGFEPVGKLRVWLWD